MLTPALLVAATGCTPQAAEHFAPALEAAMQEFGVDTPLRRAHFLAQCAHESELFEHVEESFNYSPEGLCTTFPRYFYCPPGLKKFPGQQDATKFARSSGPPARPARQSAIAEIVYGGRMGNDGEGMAWLYRGRGLIQLTGYDNYQAFSDEVGKFPAVSRPDILTTDEGAAWSAGWYWKRNSINEPADADNVAAVTRKVNGGTNGLLERQRLTQRAKAALGIANPSTPEGASP